MASQASEKKQPERKSGLAAAGADIIAPPARMKLREKDPL